MRWSSIRETVGSALTIKVAYDISFLGAFFSNEEAQSGVYRTVEQLLFALRDRQDIDLNTVAICGKDPLFDVSNSSRYVSGTPRVAGAKLQTTLRGRFGLADVYARNLGNKPANGTSSSRREITGRAKNLMTRLVRKVEQPRASFEPANYDVFHSPFLESPSRHVLRNLPKVQTVFDLICQTNPTWMPAEIVSLSKSILDSIDIERDWVTCISEFTKREFCEFTGMAPERVFVTPLAAASHFHPEEDSQHVSSIRNRYLIPPGDYFLALGAVQPRKNFLHVIRCFFRLLAESPSLEVNLVIVGATAWFYDAIFTEVENAGELRDRLIFTGFVADEDLRSIYSAARAFLFPSLYEGFGLPTLEAMQCGTPVIASNNSAFPEVVSDAGILLDPNDTDAWCQAMLQVLRDQPLREQLRAKGLMRSKHFSWDICAEKTVVAYRAAVGK